MSFQVESQQTSEPLKFLIHSMDGAGHLNSAIGLAHILVRRGHRVTFVMNDVYRGRFSSLGFGEILLHQTIREDPELPTTKNPTKTTAEQLMKNGLLSGVSPFEKMRQHNLGERCFLATLCDKLAEFDPQIEKAIQTEQPDAIIVNQFLTPPAILKSKIPWIYQYPCNSLAIYSSEKLPPFYSGFPVDSDKETWKEFREFQQTEYIQRFERYQKKLNVKCNYEPEIDLLDRISGSGYFAKSPFFNLYDTPKELDYDDDLVETPKNCVRFESFYLKVDDGNVPFEFPEEFMKVEEKLIYVSLGSMGAIDVELMKRIVKVLGKTRHKYIVSKGLRADEYELPANCWGQAYLPQSRILPLVDLVITHGGNNTVTETFVHGKPMIVLPLFFDQYDNAQRLQEKGLGIRLEPYEFEESELIRAIDQLLGNDELAQRLEAIAKRINDLQSTIEACVMIENNVEQFWSKLKL